MLLRLLKHKFTDVPNHVEQKIKSATINHIYKWFLKALDAGTIDEVFNTKLNGH